MDEVDLDYFDVGSTVFILERPYVVRSIRRADKGFHVAFEEIRDRTGAEAIRNSDVLVSERRRLGDSEYWPDQLVGLTVQPGGGEVTGVLHGPGQDRLVIERDGTRFEVPFVDELVPVVDLTRGIVEIREIEGLSEPSG